MLTENFFHFFTTVGAEWVLWLLVGLSVASIGLILERLWYYARYSSPEAVEVLPLLSAGKWKEAHDLLADKRGLEAQVLLEALEARDNGPDQVEDLIAGAIVRKRQPFERSLSFLGTLGNNAPFIGLFGTVIGIIQAFATLAVGEGAAGSGTSAVMAGISEALVATAVGIFVAIPAVVAFNGYNRWLRSIVGRTNALGLALVAALRKEEP